MATAAPARLSRSTIACPMPREPPVTSATLPWRESFMGVKLAQNGGGANLGCEFSKGRRMLYRPESEFPSYLLFVQTAGAVPLFYR
jgi:hypothetical protein